MLRCDAHHGQISLIFINSYMRVRKQQRLQEYDYRSPGIYFVTITLDNKKFVFGKIIDEKMYLNKYGKILNECWRDLPNHYMNIELDKYVIMSDHFHGIIQIIDRIYVRNGFKPFRTGNKIHGLPEIIRAFKTFSSRKINDLQSKKSFKWHKSFNDRIIRKNGYELERFRNYIINNPKNFE